MASAWAFEHGRCSIVDNEFLPSVRERGLTDEEILGHKEELGRRGAIKNHSVIGGITDFDVAKPVFLQCVRTAKRSKKFQNTIPRACFASK